EEARDQVRREALDDMARQVAAAEEESRREAAPEAARQISVADGRTRRQAGEDGPKAGGGTAIPVLAVDVDDATDTAEGGLPLHKWLQPATTDDESATVDWLHALLAKPSPPRSE